MKSEFMKYHAMTTFIRTWSYVLRMCDEVMSSKEKPKLNVQWSVEGERTSKFKCFSFSFNELKTCFV